MSKGFIENNLNCGGDDWKRNELCQKYFPYVKGNGDDPDNEIMNKIMMITGGEKAILNFWTFLLGPLYYVYRKCYKQAALFFLAEILAAFIPLGAVVVQILASMMFYKLYVKQMDEWIAEGKDPGETGGTNMKLTIIIAAVFAAFAVAVYIAFMTMYSIIFSSF